MLRDKDECEHIATNRAEVTLLGGLNGLRSNGGTQFYNQDRVYSAYGVAESIATGFMPWYGGNEMRIRKLTEGECLRLMGFEEKDTEACKEAGQSKANIYHEAGDSIVVTCLMAIFGELLGDENYREKVEAYADRLHEECVGK